jgi:hypoxia up-regulated 1
VIASYFDTEVEIGTHLNGDESMALGAAFFAANMSRYFRVRPVHFYDGF